MPYAISLVLSAQTCCWLCIASPSSAGCALTHTGDPRLSLMPPHAKKHLAVLCSLNHPLSVLFIRFCSRKYQRASLSAQSSLGQGLGFFKFLFYWLGSEVWHSATGETAGGLSAAASGLPGLALRGHSVLTPGAQHGGSTGEGGPLLTSPRCSGTPQWVVRHGARPSLCWHHRGWAALAPPPRLHQGGLRPVVQKALQLCSQHRPT